MSTDATSEHVARLGLTRRELAASVGCSVGTAYRLSHPGHRVRKETVERVLALHADAEIPADAGDPIIY